jgi:hypothetical protein
VYSVGPGKELAFNSVMPPAHDALMKRRGSVWLVIALLLLSAPVHVSALAVVPAAPGAVLATATPTPERRDGETVTTGVVRGRPPAAGRHSPRNPGPAHALPRLPVAHANHLGTPRVVLADYMMWYSPETFNNGLTFDIPEAGPYSSADPETLRRQIRQAQSACLDGFTAHWYGPFEPRTTAGFERLLQASATTNLQHAVVLLTNSWYGADEKMLTDAIQYVVDHWAYRPNYLRLGGRPVIFFTDMQRPWNSIGAAKAGWARIRAAVDPDHKQIWMAEGLTAAYNPLFDGLYVYRIDHRDAPGAWTKQPWYANALRAVEQQGNLPLGGLYFADSIAPGYDDTRAVNAPMDVRVPAPPFARDRRNGGYYADTFAVTAQTNGDFLIVKSFNEWVEGTAIEPGKGYGDLYLNMTCDFASQYRNR